MYWGAAGRADPWRTRPTGSTQFFDSVLAGAVVDQLAEYSVPASRSGTAAASGGPWCRTPSPERSVTDAEIQQLLRQQLGTDPAFPAVGPNSLYFVYLPPGTAVVQGGTRSCQAFCGYHNVFDG